MIPNSKFLLSVRRSIDLFNRFKEVPSLRDKASRLYYACFHVAVAAVNLKTDFYDLARAEGKTIHHSIRTIYPKFYSKTKKNAIIDGFKFSVKYKLWSDLRNVADYEVFGINFEDKSLTTTMSELNEMERCFKSHIAYYHDKSLLSSHQNIDLKGIL